MVRLFFRFVGALYGAGFSDTPQAANGFRKGTRNCADAAILDRASVGRRESLFGFLRNYLYV